MSSLYDYVNTSIYCLLGFSFQLLILSLRKNTALIDRINIIENQRLSEQVDTMIGKIDSISKGTRKLPERVHTVEFDIQKLSQSFDKLTDRMCCKTLRQF